MSRSVRTTEDGCGAASSGRRPSGRECRYRDDVRFLSTYLSRTGETWTRGRRHGARIVSCVRGLDAGAVKEDAVLCASTNEGAVYATRSSRARIAPAVRPTVGEGKELARQKSLACGQTQPR